MSEIINLGGFTDEIKPYLPYSFSLHEITNGRSDISEIKLINPENHVIDKIAIWIGGENILEYEGDEIDNIILPEGGLLVSKASYLTFNIKIFFNEEYIRSKCSYAMEDEYETIIEEGTELLQFKDAETDEVREGYLYSSRRERTGKKVRTLLSYPCIDLPIIECILVTARDSSGRIITPFWDTIKIEPSKDSTDYVNRLIEKHELQMKDGTSIMEHYKEGEPFIAKIKNGIQYIGNMAGKTHIF
jgi:hypothetical protein